MDEQEADSTGDFSFHGISSLVMSFTFTFTASALLF